jgi:hypothetical protein
VGGCYAPSPPDRIEPKLISINIENKTFEHRIEVLLIKKIRDEFISDGRLGFAENGADIRLHGQITGYTEEKMIGEKHVIIKGLFTLKDLQTNKVLWENRLIKGSFVASTSAEAKKGALDSLARNVVIRTLQPTASR